MLDYYYNHSESKISIGNFINWARNADNPEIIHQYYKDRAFVENGIISLKLLRHPANYIPTKPAQYDNPSAFLLAYFRKALTFSEFSKLNYEIDEHNWASILWDKPNIVNWLRIYNFFPTLKNRQECFNEFQNFIDSLNFPEEVPGYSPSDKFEIIIKFHNKYVNVFVKLIDRAKYTKQPAEIIKLIHIMKQKVEILLKVNATSNNSDETKLAICTNLSNNWLYFLSFIADRARRLNSNIPEIIFDSLSSLIKILLDHKKSYLVSFIFISNLPPLLSYLNPNQRNKILSMIQRQINTFIFPEIFNWYQMRVKMYSVTINGDYPLDQIFEESLEELNELKTKDAIDICIQWNKVNPNGLNEKEYHEFIKILRKKKLLKEVLGPIYYFKRKYIIDVWGEFAVDTIYEDIELIELPWLIVARFTIFLNSIGLNESIHLQTLNKIKAQMLPDLEQFLFFRVYYNNQENFWNSINHHNSELPNDNEYLNPVPGLIFSLEPAKNAVKYLNQPDSIKSLCYYLLNKARGNKINIDDKSHGIRDKILLNILENYKLSIVQRCELLSRLTNQNLRFSNYLIPYINIDNNLHKKAFGDYFIILLFLL